VAYTLGMAFAPRATLELTGLVPLSFFLVGKFLPLLAIRGESTFGPYELGLVIWVMDTVNITLIVYSLQALNKIRRLRRGLDRVQANAQLVLRAYPKIRKAAVAGVVAFVLFPIAGTGAVVGAFIGVLLGMHRAVLIAAVSFGGLIGGMMMAFLASNFRAALERFQEMQQDPTLKYVLIAAVAALAIVGVVLLNRAYRRALAKAEAEAEAETELEEAAAEAEEAAAGAGDDRPDGCADGESE
jgi:uncharacterized membrane protein